MATWQEERQRLEKERLAAEAAVKAAAMNEVGGGVGGQGGVGGVGGVGGQGGVGATSGSVFQKTPGQRAAKAANTQAAINARAAQGPSQEGSQQQVAQPVTGEEKFLLNKLLLNKTLNKDAQDTVASQLQQEGTTSGPPAAVDVVSPFSGEKVFDTYLANRGLNENVQGAAQAYRNLPANATPEQRQAAKQEYAKALEAKAVDARQVGGAPEGRSRPMQETGAITAFEAFGKQPAVRPGEDPASIARYNQYLEKKKGINPFTIGGAVMMAGGPGTVPGAGGLDVLTPEEEQAAKATVEDAAKRIRDLAREERQMKFAGKYHYGPDEWAKVNKLREERKALEVEAGFRNPMDRKAGLDPQAALARELGNRRLEKDQSSLPAVAEKDLIKQRGKAAQEEEQRKQSVERQTPGEPSADLTRLANYEAQQRALAFEEERRRQQMIAAQLYGPKYAYNY